MENETTFFINKIARSLEFAREVRHERIIAMWIVELEEDCWLAPWSGDPGRTLVRESATKYKTESAAKRALDAEKKRFDFRDFSRSRVVPNTELT